MQDGGPLAALDMLAFCGLPVPEGVVFLQKAHEKFLRAGGLLAAIRSCDAAGDPSLGARLLRRAYASAPVGEVLHGLITEAAIGLKARSVSVLSEGEVWQNLSTVPDVRDAIREAWLSEAGLDRQVRAAPCVDPPTWPVLVQREVHPEQVGWTLAGGEKPAALHDVRAARGDPPSERGIAELTLEASTVLDGPARLRWGLESGTWYVLGVERIL